MTPPLLSVVIPNWNRAHLICEAIDSALTQKLGRVEVIVVDDGSTDDSVERVTRNFGSRVRLLSTGCRAGPGPARNVGIGMASGQLLAFLDTDDVWLPGKLDAELCALERFPDAEAVVSDNMSFLEGQVVDHSRFALNGLLAAAQGQTRPLRDCPWLWTNFLNSVAMCTMTIRRSALARFAGNYFAEDLVYCEDWEFELRVFHSCCVVVLPEIWSWVRRFEDGTRVGRAIPGNPRTREQDIRLQRDRLTVMERARWISSVNPVLATELERCRVGTARQLAQLERAEPITQPSDIS